MIPLLRIAPLLCLWLATLATFPASAQIALDASSDVTEEMLFADDPKSWLRPKAIVPPEFPAEQLKAKATGYVDIDVSIDKAGKVTSARIVKSNPENKAFEMAVSETIKYWLFRQRADVNCEPIARTSNVRVWFDIRDGNNWRGARVDRFRSRPQLDSKPAEPAS